MITLMATLSTHWPSMHRLKLSRPMNQSGDGTIRAASDTCWATMKTFLNLRTLQLEVTVSFFLENLFGGLNKFWIKMEFLNSKTVKKIRWIHLIKITKFDLIELNCEVCRLPWSDCCRRRTRLQCALHRWWQAVRWTRRRCRPRPATGRPASRCAPSRRTLWIRRWPLVRRGTARSAKREIDLLIIFQKKKN